MPEDMLETLRAIDPAILAEVVQQDQRSSTFEVLNWTVKRLSDKGIMNPDGLFLFSGEGRDKQRIGSWSVVLKIIKDPGGEPDSSSAFYWKREFLLMQCGLMKKLPGPLAVPRFYSMPEDGSTIWIWMEHIKETVNPRWTTEEYVFAVRQFGQFSAACLNLKPLPDFPWLCKSHIREWIAVGEHYQDWDNPFVTKAFSSQLRQRVTKLWDERERFIYVLEKLPQVLSHFDSHRRNLFIRQSTEGREELVVIDWSWCGYGALGGEAFSLIGNNVLFFEVEPEAATEFDAIAFPAYVEGLREGGFKFF
jgi:hypothetical protein